MVLKNLQTAIVVTLTIKFSPFLKRNIRNRISTALVIVKLHVGVKPFSLAKHGTV